jgi:hypothetical protein
MNMQCTRQLAGTRSGMRTVNGALLRFGERDGPHTLASSGGLDLFAFRWHELEGLGGDRLVESDRERGDLVEGLLVADRGDGQ